jgi:hypothetical protein
VNGNQIASRLPLWSSRSTELAQLTADLFGLTCAGDAVRIERRLLALKGVVAAVVNPALDRAYLTVDRRWFSLSDLDDAFAELEFRMRHTPEFVSPAPE